MSEKRPNPNTYELAAMRTTLIRAGRAEWTIRLCCPDGICRMYDCGPSESTVHDANGNRVIKIEYQWWKGQYTAIAVNPDGSESGISSGNPAPEIALLQCLQQIDANR